MSSRQLRSHGLPAAACLALLIAPAASDLAAQQGSGGGDPRVPSEVTAQAPVTVHPEASEAISELRSPYCPGLMLEVCTSPGAAHLRDSIDALARSGQSSDEIVEGVLASYGEEWRAVPRREGFGWWAWLMPPVALVAGLLVVAGFLARRRKTGTTPEIDSALEPDPERDEKLRRALEELEVSERPEW